MAEERMPTPLSSGFSSSTRCPTMRRPPRRSFVAGAPTAQPRTPALWRGCAPLSACAYQRTHDLSQHGVQPPLLLQPPVLALPAPQAEAQGRRHFRSRNSTAAEPAALPPTPPTLVAPAPPSAITSDAAPPSPVPLMMPADSPEPALALPSPSPPQLGAVPYPVKDEDPLSDDSDLPFEAKLVNGKWSYGVKKPTKRGHVIRWFSEQHFLPLELESEHFELLRRPAAPNNS